MITRALFVLVVLLAASPAWGWTSAQEAVPAAIDEGPQPEGVETQELSGRVVAPVYVNGQGPFRFIVDTGANRSAVSRRLAGKLGLKTQGQGEVHAVTGVRMADLAPVSDLKSGALHLTDNMLPVLDSAIIGGADGMLGMEGMAGKRILIDLENDQFSIVESNNKRLPGRDWATLDAKVRFGSLVVADGRVGDIPVKVVFDTGAPTSLANPALREAIASGKGKVRRRATPSGAPSTTRIMSAAAPIVVGDAIVLPSLSLDNLHVANTVVLVSDFYIFSLWGLMDKPAIVLGMDVLSQTRAVSIDYKRKEVRLKMQPGFDSGF